VSARQETGPLKVHLRVPPGMWERFMRRLRASWPPIRRGEPIAAGVLVAVSGGPDSMVLAHLLARVRWKRGGSLTLCYVDHRVRSVRERARDVALVRRCAAALGVPFLVERVDRGVRHDENSLRAARYDALVRAARRAGCSLVALGHTQDDVVETFLFNLMRGAGIRGLSGVTASRAMAPGVMLVRPLLDIRKSEILTFARAAGIRYAVDSTNRSGVYTRNRIRRSLIPLMERIVPGAAAHVAQTARLIAAVSAALDALTAGLVQVKGTTVSLRRERLARLPAFIRDDALVRSLETAARLQGVRLQSAREPLLVRLRALCDGEQQTVILKKHLVARRRGSRIELGPSELLR